MLTLHILHQDETPLLYSLVLGEGVVNDATSVVHFNVVQKIHVESIYGLTALRVFENFISLSFSVATAIQKDEGWCYIGCFGWSKKLVREESFFTCVACNKLMLWLNSAKTKYSFPYDRYRVIFLGYVNAQVDTDLPRSLGDILAPMPTFAEGVQIPEADTPGSDARLANTCKVAEQATTSDVSLPGRLAAAKEQVILERMPRRKHV
ncbi:unnamed protein product [Brassica oleracea var. botrytis]